MNLKLTNTGRKMDLAKTWRVMGLKTDNSEFLIVMGSSREECERLFQSALSEYSHVELKEVDSAWIEEWIHDDLFDRSAWMPRTELSLRRLRLRAAAIQQHAMRRSA
ncbi:hypothetical protein K2Y11_00500 [bacterium]|nr:hypothetical protein [bacterium]